MTEKVCPTGVGMNRSEASGTEVCVRMPHRRGDEPEYKKLNVEVEEVCPTGVGMNRTKQEKNDADQGMPHRRGDEPPGRSLSAAWLKYAPQAWG